MPMKLCGKSPLKKLNRAKGKKSHQEGKKEEEEEDIGRLVTREQIDLFTRIVQQELPKMIVDMDRLRQNEFKIEHLMAKCLSGAAELSQHLLAPNSRAEVDAYIELYSLADCSNFGFLFPRGPVSVNQAVVEVVNLLLEQLHQLAEHCTQAAFALKLAVAPYSKRTAFEYSLLQEVTGEFEGVGSWAKHQYAEQSTLFLNWHASEMVDLVRFPQYEDRRRAYLRGEQVQLKALSSVFSQLFFATVSLYDTVVKNGHKLGDILGKARAAA